MVALAAPAVQWPGESVPDWLDEYIGEQERKRQEQRRRAAQRRRAKVSDVLPTHVRNCRKWGLYCWRPDMPAKVIRMQYACRSWRCHHCRGHEAHVLFARGQEAVAQATAGESNRVTFMVLTFARRGEKAPLDVNHAYREISTRWNKFIKRLRRWMARMGMDPLRNEWIQTVECHADGWPHVNVIICHAGLSDWVDRVHASRAGVSLTTWRADRQRLRSRDVILLPDELDSIAAGAGFGHQSTIEVADSADAAMGYIVKIAAKQDKVLGEVAKLTQLPTMAPQRFRRYRSGKRFLPKRKEPDGRHTGTLAMRRREPDGTVTVAIAGSFDAVGEHKIQLERVRSLELDLAEEEDVAFARSGKPLTRPPILTHQPLIGWFGFDSQEALARMSASLGTRL